MLSESRAWLPLGNHALWVNWDGIKGNRTGYKGVVETWYDRMVAQGQPFVEEKLWLE
jgi:hypothetical protein